MALAVFLQESFSIAVTSLIESGEVSLSLGGTEHVAGAPTGVTPMYKGEWSNPYIVNTPCPLHPGGRVVDTTDGLVIGTMYLNSLTQVQPLT